MLSSFWRRKNVRLVQRLNAAIETTERLSEVYNAPKSPRVAIDTSYVDRKSRHPTITHSQNNNPHRASPADHTDAGVNADDARGYDASSLKDLGPAHSDETAPVHHDTHHAEGTSTFEPHAEPATAESWGDNISLIKEAVEQLELAERRETETLQELESLRRRTEELKAAITAEKEARRAAEAASDEAKALAVSTTQELSSLRSSPTTAAAPEGTETQVRAHLEAKLMLEQVARREADAQREKISKSLNEANEQIEALRKAAAEVSAAPTQPPVLSPSNETLEEIAALRARNDELAGEAAKAREALMRAQSDVKAAQQAADAANKQVVTLREASTKLSDIENELSATKAREAEASAKAQSLESRIQELDSQISSIEADRSREQEASHKQAEDNAAEIAALRLAAEQLTEQCTRKDDDLRKRHEALLNEGEQLRGHIAGIEAALANERETAKASIDAANAEIAALRATTQELTDNRTRESSEFEQHTAATLSQVEALRSQIAKLEDERDTERRAAAKAASEAATEIEALRQAAQELATGRAHTEAEESAKIEELRRELDALRHRANQLESDLASAEAARLSAEFDRDTAQEKYNEAETKLAALHEQRPAQPSPAPIVTTEPPVFRTTSTANAGALIPTSDSSPEPSPTHPEPSIFAQHSDDTPVETTQVRTTKTSVEVNDTPKPSAPAGGEFTACSNDHDPAQADGEPERRGREKRQPSQMAVTLWTESWGQPLSCFLVDKSSRGAKIEMKPDRIFGGNNRINVGDRLTLTFYYAHERTSVFCDVMWMDGNFLGVKYYGQFHTEINKPRPTPHRRSGTGR